MLKNILFSSFIFVSLISCSTTKSINISEQLPAEIDFSDSKTISLVTTEKPEKVYYNRKHSTILGSVVGFFADENSSNYSEHKDFINELNSDLTNALNEQKKLKYIENNSDLELSIKIKNLSTEISTEKESYTSLDKEFSRTVYKKECSVTLFYEIKDTSTNEVLSTKSLGDTKITREYREGALSSVSKMLKSTKDNFIKSIRNNFEEHKDNYSFKLLNIKSKTEASKKAEELITNNNNEEAAKIYKDIYDNSKDLSSCFNSAILYWSIGNYSEAKKMFDEIAKADSNFYKSIRETFEHSISRNAKICK